MGSKDISYKVFYTMIMEIQVSKSLLVRISIIKCFFGLLFQFLSRSMYAHIQASVELCYPSRKINTGLSKFQA